MGRKIPVAQIESYHPILAWSFFIACIAATIAIVSSLCGALSRKKSPPVSATKSNTNENPEDAAPQFDESTKARDTTSMSTSMAANQEDKNDEDYLKQPLPPPPAMHAASHHHRSHSTASSQGRLSSSMSQGNLLSSMSMRVGGNGMSSRQSSRREDNDKKRDKKLKHEDSIWKKQIILGEKCRVPDEDDDTILYDENGNRISTYHPRIPSSLPVSRQTSDVDPDAIPK